MRTGQWNVCLVLLFCLFPLTGNPAFGEEAGESSSCRKCSSHQVAKSPLRACGCKINACDCERTNKIALAGPKNQIQHEIQEKTQTPTVNQFAVIPASFVEEFDESAEGEVVVLEPVPHTEDEDKERDRVAALMQELAKRSHHNREVHNIPIPSETKPPIEQELEEADERDEEELATFEPATLPNILLNSSMFDRTSAAAKRTQQAKTSFNVANSVCKCTSMGCGTACQTAKCRPVCEASWAMSKCNRRPADACNCGSACKCGTECKCTTESKCEKSCNCSNADSAGSQTNELIEACSKIDSVDEYFEAIAVIVERAGNGEEKTLNRALLALANAKMETMLHMVELQTEYQAEVHEELHELAIENARLETAVEALQGMVEMSSESLKVLTATGATNQVHLPTTVQPTYHVQRPTLVPANNDSNGNDSAPTRVAELPPTKSSPGIHVPQIRSSMPMYRPENSPKRFSFHNGGKR